MSRAMKPPRPRALPEFDLAGAVVHALILLCWAGVVPAWRLLPEQLQPTVERALTPLHWPALALCAAVLLVALLRLAVMRRGLLDRLARLVLQLGELAFALLVFRVLLGLSFAGYGLDWRWTVVMAWLHLGATVGLVVLPWVAVIVVIAGVVGLLRSWWPAQPASR